jgi:flagellar protein FlaI
VAEEGFKQYEEALKGKKIDPIVCSPEGIERIKGLLREELGGSVDEGAVEAFIYETYGMGALTPFFLSDDLEEIMVIGGGEPVYVFDRKKGTVKTETVLKEEEIQALIRRIGRYAGRTVDGDHPLLDARLPDGSRVNATLSVVSPKGSTMTIRRFRRDPLTLLDLIRLGTLDRKLMAFLWLAVEGLGLKPANILICGGTASGKTTTLNALSNFIPQQDRIISIEDTLELSLNHEHWIPLETRPPDPRGGEEIDMDALLKNALRMRPDRIIVGEVRSSDALTLFTAMNTGHDGCLATIHANSAREALTRLQNHPMNVPQVMIPALDLIVAQGRRVENGKLQRRVFEVAEIGGREGDNILTNTLFRYEPETGRIETKILNGRIIQELSTLTQMSIREIDEEIEKRETLLHAMVEARLSLQELHETVQKYYEDPERAVELLYTKTTRQHNPSKER